MWTPEFETFLRDAKDDPALAPDRGGAPENTRFIPRNFLLEERLDAIRQNSYLSEFPPGEPAGFAQWNAAHNLYLKKHIFVAPPVTHDYRTVPKGNRDVCPETFRTGSALLTFQGTDLDTYLIRLVPVADIASMARREHQVDLIHSLGAQVALDPERDTPERQQLAAILHEAYAITNDRCDHRPVFAAFYEDFKDNELADPSNDLWPNRLRDRLGAYRLSQFDASGLPHPVFLFKYLVRDLPLHPGDRGIRPLAVPLVIDQKLSEVFCPAPKQLDRGRTLNLQANAIEEPAREVLHLFMPMRAERLVRAGLITEPVPDNLADARRDHLIWTRLAADRDDFASHTDSDSLT